MTVLFKDIEINDKAKTRRHRITGMNADQILYADDTICVTQSPGAMNRLLKAIEEGGEYYGLRLNKKKCEVIGNRNSNITFKDGTKVNRKDEVKYLGCWLNEKADIDKEVKKRIAKCATTLAKMHTCWRHGDCTTKTKIQVLNEVIRSKVLYGLESAAMNPGTIRRLNAFQMRGIRKIMKMPNTYLEQHRGFTNKFVTDSANAEILKENRNAKIIEPFEDRYKERRLSAITKVIMTEGKNPAATITMQEGFLKSHEWGPNRRGRPRKKWLKEALSDLWKEGRRMKMRGLEEEFDVDKYKHRRRIYDIARRLNDER